MTRTVLLLAADRPSALAAAVKSQAGWVVEWRTASGQQRHTLLLAEGRVGGDPAGRWLPDSGWPEGDLEALGFVRVGEGDSERWLAPEARE